MTRHTPQDLTAQIIEKAKYFGASLAGVARVDLLKKSPSHRIYAKLDDYQTVASSEGDIKPGEVYWPETAKSAIVIAVEHPADRPELDWWQYGFNGGTTGNQILIAVNTELSKWLETEKGIPTNPLPYHVEKGGVFLKDAAVMAGLGCIGKNNMLVTPQFGPLVRLRAMLTDEVLADTGPVDFDPCKGCHMPCLDACPKEVFKSKVYSEKAYGIEQLPGRSGSFSTTLCNQQMELDQDKGEEIRIEGQDITGKVVKYCRQCEFACPVGR